MVAQHGMAMFYTHQPGRADDVLVRRAGSLAMDSRCRKPPVNPVESDPCFHDAKEPGSMNSFTGKNNENKQEITCHNNLADSLS